MTAPKAQQVLFTIGYEGRKPDEFLQTLQREGVKVVVDVRALPLSRRKGFSKTPLREALAREGIEYVHVRAAGNPFRAEKDDIAACLRHFSQHLSNHPEVIDEVEVVVEGRKAALLCMERDSKQCHRGVLARSMVRRLPTRELRHL